MKFFFNQIKHHLLFIVALAIIVNPLYSMHNGFLNENNNLNENNAQQLFDDNQMQVLNQIYNEIQERLAQNQPRAILCLLPIWTG